MHIYQISEAIESLIDPETGEILDLDAFLDLQMQKEEKIENMALWVKNLTAEAAAIKAEKNALAERERVAKNKADSLKKYLATILSGEKFTTPKVAVSFRKSSAVELGDDFAGWAIINAPHLLKFAEPTADKTAIKDALTSGVEVRGAAIIERQSIQIK